MYPDKRVLFLSEQSRNNYYKLLHDLEDHSCSLALGAGASATVGLPTWSLLLKRICHCYFEQWTMGISSGNKRTNEPPENVSIALTNSYDTYLLKKKHPEYMNFEKLLNHTEYIINGHKLSDAEARKESQKMIDSEKLVLQLQDDFMEKILSGDMTVTAQMIKNHVRPRDWNYLIRKSIYSSYEDSLYVLKNSSLYDSLIKLVGRYKINNIINYNYDDTFYHSLHKAGFLYRNCYQGSKKQWKNCIYYPHGYIPMKGGVTTEIILSEDDYQQQIYHQNNWSNNIQLSNFMTSTCIFIGLSMNDSNIRRIMNMGADAGPYNHYAFIPSAGSDKATVMYESLFDSDMRRLGIRVIRYPAINNYKELSNLLTYLSDNSLYKNI